jgi:hypothetical protein
MIFYIYVLIAGGFIGMVGIVLMCCFVISGRCSDIERSQIK